MSKRDKVTFKSGSGTCDGWWYSAGSKAPTLVLAHGLGAVKEMSLDDYAEIFLKAGFSCLVFDYRHFGHSTGKPRHLIDIPKQLEDWNSALTYVRSRDDVNLERIGLFGTSFSGGHVIRVAAGDDKIWAVISQCPFTSGFRSALTTSQLQAPYMMFQALRDYFTNSDENPVTLPLADVPGSPALMSAHDVVSGYNAIKPADLVHSNQTPARILLSLPFAFPGSYAKDVKCPIFFAICMKDTVAPAGASISYAEKAPKGVVKKYEDMGHFSIYKGEDRDRATGDYVSFLKSHL